jgi:hypothetical protein
MTSISTLQFRRLLYDLLSRAPDTKVRFRLIGKMWKPNFLQIHSVTEQGAIFTDETIQEFVFVSDLSEVMQFEIDFRFQDFHPHFHYEVKPARD